MEWQRGIRAPNVSVWGGEEVERGGESGQIAGGREERRMDRFLNYDRHQIATFSRILTDAVKLIAKLYFCFTFANEIFAFKLKNKR